jgi:xanthine dehydrogenase small subunit
VRAALSSKQCVDVASVDAALNALHDDPALVPMAGCTDLYVLLNAGTLPAPRLLNIWRLDELRGIDASGGLLRLGALATYTDVIRSNAVATHLPMLVEASRQVGGVQIHNRGTLGGNIANASPAGDTLPVFAAADAVVVLRSLRGERRVPFNGFYTGYRASVRERDELIVAIEVPPVPGRQWYRKVGTRAAQAISKVVMAAVRTEEPRVALGSVAPTVVRATASERALASGESIQAARAALDETIVPIDDFRSSARYRRLVAGNLLARFWIETG